MMLHSKKEEAYSIHLSGISKKGIEQGQMTSRLVDFVEDLMKDSMKIH